MSHRFIPALIVTLLSLVGGNVLAAPADFDAPYRPIFNGQDLAGWSGDERFWRVEDGVIVGQTTSDNPTQGNTFLTWAQGEIDDFELKLQFRLASDKGNSGIQIRSQQQPNHVVGGYQADISNDDWSGVLYEERGRGILARRGQKRTGDNTEKFAEEAERLDHYKPGEWNEYHITARGNHLTLRINGEVMCEVVDTGDKAKRSGILALQLHAGPPMRIEFKDIRLKRLPLGNGQKKVVMVAGRPSHAYGAHEHYAGVKLFERLLNENTDNIISTVYRNGWPADPTAFDNADSVVIYADGGRGHPVMQHLESFDEVMKRGVGLVCLHYAVEVPADPAGKYFLEWIGGYFEMHWSVNPHWTIEDMQLGKPHPITRGVTPYVMNDEWYYHMRFPDELKGVDPIVSALPPAQSLSRPDGPHSGNPHVRKAVLEDKHPQHTAWARTRPDGGRGFGFTGGHFHWNWGHPEQLRLVLNAIVWSTGAEVPENGITFAPLTLEELEANQDGKQPENFDREKMRKKIQEWNGR